MRRFGVTGTDTGVGKTVVACALAAAFVRRGARTVAMKPIETGVAAEDPSRDGARLARAAGHEHSLNRTAPLVLPDPVAPLVAARRAGRAIDLSALDRALELASTHADVLIVEGAGGLLVPIAGGVSFDTLFRRWSLDLIIVAANRLGVINHTRLTCAAARAAGLPVRAVVLNSTVSTIDGDVSVPDNARVIAELENVPVIELPWIDQPDDAPRAAAAAERAGLLDLLTASPIPVRVTA